MCLRIIKLTSVNTKNWTRPPVATLAGLFNECPTSIDTKNVLFPILSISIL